MSSAIESAKKLPFANYDLSVYFGVGILSLPFVAWLVSGTFTQYFPRFYVPGSSEFVNTTVELLAILFAGYALGHIIAFISSYVIEKFLHRHYGYPSDLYLEQCDQDKLDIDFDISWQKMVASPSMFVMALFHLPVFPAYIALHLIRARGYYLPKLPLELRSQVDANFARAELPTRAQKGTRWAKVVEHYVANHCPSGYARMYNYLVIFGILRSLSFMAILFTWSYVASALLDRHFGPDGRLMHLHFHPLDAPLSFVFGLLLCIAFSALCFMNFAKFNRRYFEEGVQAFVLANPIQRSPPRVRTL